MGRSRTAGVVLKYSVDRRSAREAARANDNQIQGLRRLARETREIQSSRVDDVLRGNARAAASAADSYERAAASAARLRGAQSRFDETSRNVQLAGDVQSNLGAIGGLADVAGLGGLGGGIAAAGEVSALIEELPRLKASFQGLPSTISAAGQALGTSGAGLIGSIGALGLAAGAVAASIAIAAEQINKSGEAFSRAVDAQIEAERLIAQGGTVEQAQQRIQDLEAEAEALRTVNERVRAATPGFIELAASIPLINRLPFFGKFREEFEELETGIDAAKKEASAYQDAIDAGRLATEEATSAQAQTASTERDLATARTQSVNASAQAAQAERSLFEERLSAIREGGAGGGGFAGQPDIAGVGDTIGTVGSTVIGRRSRGGNRRESERVQEAQEQANRLTEIERNTGNRRADIARETNDRLADVARAAGDRIADIRRESDREEADAERQRNFLALADARRDEERAINDAQRQLERQRRDIGIEAQRQRRDLVIEARRQREDLVGVQRQTYQDTVNAAQQWGQAFTETINRALAQAGGGGSQSNSRSQRSSYRQRRAFG